MRGTYAYISPEVYFGQSFTPKSDVYAFAIVAWELVTKCIKVDCLNQLDFIRRFLFLTFGREFINHHILSSKH